MYRRSGNFQCNKIFINAWIYLWKSMWNILATLLWYLYIGSAMNLQCMYTHNYYQVSYTIALTTYLIYILAKLILRIIIRFIVGFYTGFLAWGYLLVHQWGVKNVRGPPPWVSQKNVENLASLAMLDKFNACHLL